MYIFTNSATLVIVCLCCHPACPYIVLRPAPCVCVCVCVHWWLQAIDAAGAAASFVGRSADFHQPLPAGLLPGALLPTLQPHPARYRVYMAGLSWPPAADGGDGIVLVRCAVVLSRCAALCGAVPQRQARQHTLLDSRAAVGYLSGERTSIWRRDLATIMLGPGPEEVSTWCLRVCGVASAVGPERMGLRCLILYARSIWPGCGGGWVSGSRRRASWPRRGLTTR